VQQLRRNDEYEAAGTDEAQGAETEDQQLGCQKLSVLSPQPAGCKLSKLLRHSTAQVREPAKAEAKAAEPQPQRRPSIREYMGMSDLSERGKRAGEQLEDAEDSEQDPLSKRADNIAVGDGEVQDGAMSDGGVASAHPKRTLSWERPDVGQRNVRRKVTGKVRPPATVLSR
jgi:hypothetical protein